MSAALRRALTAHIYAPVGVNSVRPPDSRAQCGTALVAPVPAPVGADIIRPHNPSYLKNPNLGAHAKAQRLSLISYLLSLIFS